jgi:hypothetical protein
LRDVADVQRKTKYSFENYQDQDQARGSQPLWSARQSAAFVLAVSGLFWAAAALILFQTF